MTKRETGFSISALHMMRSFLSFFIVFFFSLGLLSAQNAYVTCQAADNVNVIDINTDTVVTTVGVGDTPFGVALTPDNLIAYVANNLGPSVSVIDTSTNTVITTITTGVRLNPFDIAVSPDGSVAYLTAELGFVNVIDTSTNTVVDEIAIFGGSPRGLAFTPNGIANYVAYIPPAPRLSGVGASHNTAILSVNINFAAAMLTVGDTPTGVAITPDGLTVYVVNMGDDSVSVIDTNFNVIVTTINGAGNFSSPFGVAITPDGTKAYVTNTDNIAIINTATNTVSGSIPVPGETRLNGVAITSDGLKAYVAGETTDTVYVINVLTDSVIDSIPVDEEPRSIALQTIPEPPPPPPPPPPSQVSGVSERNSYLTQTDIINIITWTMPTGIFPTSYAIYRDAALTDLAGCVSASGPLRFEDHNRTENITYNYFVVATSGEGVNFTGTIIGSVSVVAK